MSELVANVLSEIIKLCSEGEGRADVFDVMYLTGLSYRSLKPILDKLVAQNELSAVDIKTYEFTGGDPVLRLKELSGVKSKTTAEKPVKARESVEPEKVEEPEEEEEEEDKRYEEYLKALMEELDNEDLDDEDFEDFEDDEDEEGEKTEDEIVNNEHSTLSLFNEDFYQKHRGQFDRDATGMLTYAFVLARYNNISYVSCEHFVAAMLLFHRRAGTVLSNLGIDGAVYKEYFLKCIDGNCSIRGFTPRAKFLLLRAIRFAEGADGVGAQANTLHVLLAMLTIPGSIAVKILTSMGADLNKIKEEAEKALRPVSD